MKETMTGESRHLIIIVSCNLSLNISKKVICRRHFEARFPYDRYDRSRSDRWEKKFSDRIDHMETGL